MKILKTLSQLHTWLSQNPHPSFVPTMGALHAGHLSLVKKAKQSTKPVLVSVFVNPAQFGPDEDFQTYPRDEKKDAKLLESAGADAVWFPTEEDIYPDGKRPKILHLPDIFSELEGRERPGHFLGVAQVITRLFSLVKPSKAFFGQKDYQQTILMHWFVEELNIPTAIVICPIVREQNGLAMSSRNEYLSPQEREAAAVLSQSLFLAESAFKEGNTDIKYILSKARNLIKKQREVKKIDYLEIRDAGTLAPISKITRPAVILLVARIGKVRLLDNIILSRKYMK